FGVGFLHFVFAEVATACSVGVAQACLIDSLAHGQQAHAGGVAACSGAGGVYSALSSGQIDAEVLFSLGNFPMAVPVVQGLYIVLVQRVYLFPETFNPPAGSGYYR